MVLFDKFLDLTAGLGTVAAVVIDQKLNLATVDPALGVHRGHPRLQRPQPGHPRRARRPRVITHRTDHDRPSPTTDAGMRSTPGTPTERPPTTAIGNGIGAPLSSRNSAGVAPAGAVSRPS